MVRDRTQIRGRLMARCRVRICFRLSFMVRPMARYFFRTKAKVKCSFIMSISVIATDRVSLVLGVDLELWLILGLGLWLFFELRLGLVFWFCKGWVRTRNRAMARV